MQASLSTSTWLEWLGPARGIALVALRVCPMALFSPLVGGRPVPLTARASFGFVLVLFFAPAVGARSVELTLPAILVEGAIGLGLALMLGLGLGAFAILWELFELARSPEAPLGDDSRDGWGVPSSASWILALALWSAAGGHRLLLEAIAQSYVRAPAGSMGGVQLGGALRLFARYFELIVAAGLPILVVGLCLELSRATVSRVVAQPDPGSGWPGLRSWLLGLVACFVFIVAMEPLLSALGETLVRFLGGP